ncbi:hypothetical protein [Streptomyces sp. NRRL F-2664]|uniref:hypothetical protein n=1 Tax=Streptomyces sp. NRRL F-2664 TaxID=1463842 RepID=UPI00068B5547|nr:hypothetical protein [Streptomyces sp. NRRL F-2664]
MTPDGERLGAHPGERPVERRLRQALDARADSVDFRRLRPARPPGTRAGRRSREGVRRFALPVAGLVAAAAAGLGYLVLGPDAPPGPRLPATTPPQVTSPGPDTGSTPTPTPTQSASRPGPAPSVDRSSGPSGFPLPLRSGSPSAQASPQRSAPLTPSRGSSVTPGAVATSSPPPSGS